MDSSPPEDDRKPDQHPDDLDAGLAFAYGEDAAESASPSVLHRIAELTGSSPKVHLREEPAGDTPMLKPLGPDDRVDAGKYVVQGELGRGGVGTVHRGHDQDLGRDVALKFLHEKYKDEPTILQRFVEEAQIGGQLQHPGIVPVYDLGMSGGKPFFSMRLVKGQTLAKKLADRPSVADDCRTFLAIFEDVCQTLAYAHARGVVHRDLKPANIMIGSFGEVQVVDWGMGKVLKAGGVADEKYAAERRSELSVIETVRSQGHGTQSVMGSVMGTPAYMPPEQARGDVEAMDERSDVFALGAILCEILTGQPPYTGAQDEMIGLAAMARLDDAKKRLANCGAEQDLVELSLACLMPAPAARPRSAEVVAQAIHDHLAAVEARVHDARVDAAAAKVRAAALATQRTLGLALTAAVAAGLLVSLWFWFDADEQRQVAEKAATDEAAAAKLAEERRVEAVQQREQVELIAEFMSETLQGAGPRVALGRDATMLREMMDAASGRIARNELEMSPEAELRLRLTIGSTYRELAAFDRAERLLRPALKMARESYPDGHEIVARVLDASAALAYERGEFGVSESLFREALAMRRRLAPGDHAEIANTLNGLGRALADSGDLVSGGELFREALALARLVKADDPGLFSVVLANLGNNMARLGQAAKAVPLLREALAIERGLTPGDHPDVVLRLNVLSAALDEAGHHEEGEKLARESLQMRRRLFDGDHPRLSTAMNNLAKMLERRGDLVAAEPLFREALAMDRRLHAGDHASIAGGLNNLAFLLDRRGDVAAAEPLYREALAMMLRLANGDHPLLPALHGNLAMFLADRGDLAGAEAECRKALEMTRRLYPEDHPDTALHLGNLAGVLEAREDAAAAEPLLREALAMRRRLFPDGHTDLVASLISLAQLLADRRDVAAAEPLLREALTLARKLHPGDHPRVAVALSNLGQLLSARNDLDGAERLVREGVAMYRRVYSGDHPIVASSLSNLGDVLERRGDLESAEQTFREALAMSRSLHPAGHVRVVAALVKLGRVVKKRGDSAAAARLRDEAQAMLRQLGGVSPSAPDRQAASKPEPGSLVERAWRALDTDAQKALELAQQAVRETRSVKCGPLQVLAEALFANGKAAEATSKMQRAMRAWRSARAAERKQLGERDLSWMQQRLKDFGK